MSQSDMSDGERELFSYARDLLNGTGDPLVAEKIAKVYRNLLWRSRAHEIDVVKENIGFLEEIGKRDNLNQETRELSVIGAPVAFTALLEHDQVAAFSLVNRIEDSYFLSTLMDTLKRIRGAQVTLYGLWRNITARLSDTALQSSTSGWINMAAAAYCQAMLPANPIAGFSIWLQACEWNQRFPSLEASTILINMAYSVMTPSDGSLYRMNNALWVFVREQEESRSLPTDLGQSAKLWSLFASLEMTRAEIAMPKIDESAIGEIWEIAVPWMTEDLPSHSSWLALETALQNLIQAKPLAALAPVKEQLEVVLQNWKEKYAMEAERSIQLSKSPSEWADRPLFSVNWTEVTDEAEIRNLLWPLALPNRILDGKSSMIERVRFMKPSFYPNQILVEVQVKLEDGTSAISSVLTSNSRLTAVLTGQSSAIHTLNARGLLKQMNEENVALDYLSFFCAYVWGESGPFRIVDSVDDIPLTESLNEETLERLQQSFREQPRKVERLPSSEWQVDVIVCYQNALFRTQFKVMPTGMVEMVSDQPLEQGLPVRRIVMRDGFRFYDGTWESTSIENTAKEN